MKVVLACHVGLEPLRHLLDALDFIQQLEDVLVLDSLYPQLPQLVPFAVEQHLTRQEVLLHLRKRVRVSYSNAHEQKRDIINTMNLHTDKA